MLKTLNLTNVGPSPKLDIEFAKRLNIITGDNGLGKSFLLDICWWALTRRWPAELNKSLPSGYMARPTTDAKATIRFSFTSLTSQELYESTFDRAEQAWSGRAGRPANPGLIIYAQVDGSFAVWDPARNYWRKKGNVDVQDRPPAYIFSPKEAWDGLYDNEHRLLCNGLIADWAGWQKENGDTFVKLRAVLDALSPSPQEKIEPGELVRISLDDPRDIPTLRMPYGQSIPILHASAGMKRIFTLAYLIVWCWAEHVKASQLLGQPPTSQIVFLVDEIESHLHPRWQRRIVKSLLSVMTSLMAEVQMQLITATHSPMLLASMEPFFDDRQDAWFDLDIVHVDNNQLDQVVLTQRPFLRLGDVSNWLTSEAFDLGHARSQEAEEVLERAAVALSDEGFGAEKAKRLDVELRGVLGETDPFWIRWRFVAEKRGWLA